MAESIRVGTFNCENLFARYRFKKNEDPGDGFTVNQTAFDIYDEASKRITAKAIKELKADILCLQEVESLNVVDRFNSRYLGGKGYKHRILVDCTDPRYIDVALLSRYPITNVRSHRHERNAKNTAFMFTRDCLEVDVDVEGRTLRLYMNHLKSMMYGRAKTRPRRQEQAERVAAIVDERESSSNYEGNYVVLGDMNDFPEGETALGSLLDHPQLVNGMTRRPDDDQWTHYYAGGNTYHQLDYLLLGKALDERANKPTPVVVRDGLPWRAERYEGERFDEVGEKTPKASDHAPAAVDIPVAALKA